ncbi:MAG: hypothetical protein WAT22_11825, partial [Saprospiraceae bacterium]
LFPISALKSLAIAIAMSVFFALILKIIYFVLLCTYFIPVALVQKKAIAKHHSLQSQNAFSIALIFINLS